VQLSPIVLFVYNRPSHTRRTLDALSKNQLADQSVLYVFADGANENADDTLLNNIYETRQIIKERKWCKEVHLIESAVNKGLASSIVEGVTQIINTYEKVIVLEDDIITSTGFLRFMNDALNVYQLDESVMHISGYLPPLSLTSIRQTFFINVTSCWGWATWKRSWIFFESRTLKLMNEILQKDPQLLIFNFNGKADYWRHLEMNLNGIIDTWAIKWYASVYLNDGFCLHPFRSLARNIGADGSGTHFKGTDKVLLSQELVDDIYVVRIPIVEDEYVRLRICEYYDKSKHKQTLETRLRRYIKRGAKSILKLIKERF
jgi:translation initiation factor 2 beta subunit (eIF-2beta)/eIF-5